MCILNCVEVLQQIYTASRNRKKLNQAVQYFKQNHLRLLIGDKGGVYMVASECAYNVR